MAVVVLPDPGSRGLHGRRGRAARRRAAVGHQLRGAPRPAPLTFGVYGHQEELEALQDGRRRTTTRPRRPARSSWSRGATTPRPRGHRGRRGPRRLHDLAPRPARPAGARRDRGRSSELLDERGVDFGDRFSRDAVQAFGVDGELQCMPYSVSPMVMYFNTDLVDFDKMQRRGLDVPRDGARPLDAGRVRGRRRVRVRPARGTRGFYIEPDACAASRRSSTPAAARSSTTPTTRSRWPSPTASTRGALERTPRGAARRRS